MPPFEPDELPPGTPPAFDDVTCGDGGGGGGGGGDGAAWVPLYSHGCTFGPDLFVDKMMNMIRNPNLNSSWLFRADVLYDRVHDGDDDGDGEADGCDDDDGGRVRDGDRDDDKNGDKAADRDDGRDDDNKAAARPLPRRIRDLPLRRTLVRRLIPRNRRRDAPLDQTCTVHQSAKASLVVYAAHAAAAADLPFYHPAVRAVAHLHRWDAGAGQGSVSIHVLPFGRRRRGREDDDGDGDDDSDGNGNGDAEAVAAGLPYKVRRTAFHLLELLHRHGQSSAAGYVKRVHHDRVVPQARLQDRYAGLKDRYARGLLDGWAEATDPFKHVFEDLAIAAFLMELWDGMYGARARFPGFVDIGCGNGLLVHVLNREGYPGWGFDARARRSWPQYRAAAAPGLTASGTSLEQRLLVPAAALHSDASASADSAADAAAASSPDWDPRLVHDGVFPAGTFIVSNHADELTPWTPILAAASRCPFAVIPCCSHNLAGDRFRAPPPPAPSHAPAGAPPPPQSTYASLVAWVARIAADCGWAVETEMLRIPSTRNTCLLGRRSLDLDGMAPADVDVDAVVRRHGGARGYAAKAARLLGAGAARGH